MKKILLIIILLSNPAYSLTYSESFIPANNPYYLINSPYSLNIYDIRVYPNNCTHPVYIYKLNLSSNCSFDDIEINFLVPTSPKDQKIYMLTSEGYILPEQKITGITPDNKYYKIYVATPYLSSFKIQVNPPIEDKIFNFDKLLRTDADLYNIMLSYIKKLSELFGVKLMSKNFNLNMKSMKNLIDDGIVAEREAISYYAFLLPYIHNGNIRRSIKHILNEERDHLKILEKLRSKL